MHRFLLAITASFVFLVPRSLAEDLVLPPSLTSSESGYTVRLTNGQSKSLTNNADAGDATKSYRYHKTPLEPQFLLFEVKLWEGGYFEFLNMINGEWTKVLGEPVFGSAKTLFVTVSGESEVAYYPCAVEIWRLLGNTFVREYSLNCDEKSWVPAKPAWRRESELSFEKAFYDPKTGSITGNKTASIVLSGKEWRIKR